MLLLGIVLWTQVKQEMVTNSNSPPPPDISSLVRVNLSYLMIKTGISSTLNSNN